jgi:hypothetical protein
LRSIVGQAAKVRDRELLRSIMREWAAGGEKVFEIGGGEVGGGFVEVVQECVQRQGRVPLVQELKAPCLVCLQSQELF